MAFCAGCGKELAAGEVFCSKCGARQTAGGVAAGAGGGDHDMALFIGSNAEKYLTKFQKFNVNDKDTFAATWHWPAFFLGFLWMLYRKMYLWALLAFFLGMIPFAAIFFGIWGNYLYFQHAKKKLAEVKALLPPSGTERTMMLAKKGGVNVAAAVAVPVIFFFGTIIVGILAAIAIPQFAAYQAKALDIKARLQLQDACSRGLGLFSEDAGRAQITAEDLMGTGFTPTDDVEITLLDGGRETFSMTGRHVRGKKVFTTDAQCSVAEQSVTQ